MTIAETRERFDKIKGDGKLFDNEAAHWAEDELHRDVLHAIATMNAEDPKEMARIALLTRALPFSRWYA